jgi:hypothetical protein
MSLVAAVLCLGQLGASLLGMAGPLDGALGDRHGNVRLADVERRVAIERRPAREVKIRTRPSREGARDRDDAATPRAGQGERRRSARRQGRRGASRVNARSHTSPPGTSIPQTPSTTTPDGSSDSTATVVATAPGADSVDEEASRSSAGETGTSRRSLLSVASVSVENGDESGSLQPGSVLRVRMAVADAAAAATTAASTTAAAATTAATTAAASTMDLRLKLSPREFETLAAKAEKSAAAQSTGSPAVPMALRARVDVVDAADAGAAGDLRVRLQLAPSPTDGSPSAVDAGDAGGRSNAVDVWAPIALPVADDDETAPGECEDEDTPAEPSGETTPGDAGETPAEPAPAGGENSTPAATEGEPVEVRLPLTPASTPAPPTGAVTVPLPEDEEPSGEPSAPGVEVAVEVTVETAPATEPPADTDVETPAEPAPVETDPAP